MERPQKMPKVAKVSVDVNIVPNPPIQLIQSKISPGEEQGAGGGADYGGAAAPRGQGAGLGDPAAAAEAEDFRSR